ncbi:MAG: hypothetical protein OXJ53_10830 [Gammaproteobacteria bacterium]|nr:hypothetical protein [Gammaproteobacteria bacterium]MDE0271452.1 hypothetical protein [Gammaproteobacteria bacterium]
MLLPDVNVLIYAHFEDVVAVNPDIPMDTFGGTEMQKAMVEDILGGDLAEDILPEVNRNDASAAM